MSKEGIATGWRRTRRNVLGIGVILAGASFSRLGIKSAHATTMTMTMKDGGHLVL